MEQQLRIKCQKLQETVVALLFGITVFGTSVGFTQSEGSSASPSSASASGANATTDTTPKRTTINFENQLVEGRAQKPELFVLLQNRMNNSRRLFRLRENFLPEMRRTAEDAGKTGSSK